MFTIQDVKTKQALLKGSTWATSGFGRYIARHWIKDVVHICHLFYRDLFPWSISLLGLIRRRETPHHFDRVYCSFVSLVYWPRCRFAHQEPGASLSWPLSTRRLHGL